MLLLRAGAQTDDIEGRKTPLTEAIREQRDEAAVLLLASSDEELTAYALVVAARDGSSNIFEILASPENQRSQRLSERAVHIRAGMGSPNKIKDVAPRYPDEAKDKRIQGIVILEAIIDAEGNVTHVRVLRSIPALDQAAIDAVKQWKYEPTLMDGVPVPIVMTVTVGFALT
jgi:TonB family protein